MLLEGLLTLMQWFWMVKIPDPWHFWIRKEVFRRPLIPNWNWKIQFQKIEVGNTVFLLLFLKWRCHLNPWAEPLFFNAFPFFFPLFHWNLIWKYHLISWCVDGNKFILWSTILARGCQIRLSFVLLGPENLECLKWRFYSRTNISR